MAQVFLKMIYIFMQKTNEKANKTSVALTCSKLKKSVKPLSMIHKKSSALFVSVLHSPYGVSCF